MKPVIGTVAAVLGVMFSISLVLANPALLPKHPGYPAKAAVSPVSGQPLANDPGQTNAGGDSASLQAAGADDRHVTQNLHDTNNERITKKEGAGRLPTVQGPQIKIEPPVKEATRMK